MAIFKYEAINKYGKSISSILVASNEIDALNNLKKYGLTPIKIQKEFVFYKSISSDDLIHFFRHVHFQVKCKTPFLKAISNYLNVTNNLKMQAIIGNIVKQLEAGKSIFYSFDSERKYFKKVIALILQSAELSGNLENSLENIVDYLQMKKSFESKIKKSLFYPLIIMLASIIATLLCLTFLAPQIKEILKTMKPEDIPLTTKICFALVPDQSVFCVIIVLGLTSMFFLFFYKRDQIIFEKIIKKIPIISTLNNKISEWNFCSIASVAINSKLSILQTINLLQKIHEKNEQNYTLTKVKKYILTGVKLSVALAEIPFLSPLTLLAIKVGEESNELGDCFAYITKIQSEKIETFIERLGVKVGVYITLFTSFILMFLVLGLFSPLYDYIGRMNE